MSRSRFFLILTGAIASVQLAHAQRASEESSKTAVYLDSSDTSPAETREARKAYADKFRPIEPRPDAGFAPGGVKGQADHC